MKTYEVTLTQSGGRHLPAVVHALDANDAARRAQKTYPGWTAVLVLEQR